MVGSCQKKTLNVDHVPQLFRLTLMQKWTIDSLGNEWAPNLLGAKNSITSSKIKDIGVPRTF
jgi:hypothetical protein